MSQWQDIPDDVREIAQRAYNFWLEPSDDGRSRDLKHVIAQAIIADRRTRSSFQGSKVGITKRQLDALSFITDFHAEHGFMPSYEEIKERLGLASKSGVHRIVHGLVERGALEMLPNRARALRLPVDQMSLPSPSTGARYEPLPPPPS